MPAADRYFCDSPIRGDKAILAGPEAHHLIHVMRAGPGTRVILFDGTGWEYSAEVESVGRAEAALVVLDRHQVDRELPVEIRLGASLPKGDRQKWLVEKAVELGVARIIPLRTSRSVAQPVEQALARLKRAVIEASKQCGRNRLMEISEPQEWADFASAAPAGGVRLLAHPETVGSGQMAVGSIRSAVWPPPTAQLPTAYCVLGHWSRRRLHGRRSCAGDLGRLAAGRSGPPHPADRDRGHPAGGTGERKSARTEA